jgi:hypothetical protein
MPAPIFIIPFAGTIYLIVSAVTRRRQSAPGNASDADR